MIERRETVNQLSGGELSATMAMAAARGAATRSGIVKRWRHSKIWPKHLDSSVVLDQRRWIHAVRWNGWATVSHECGGAPVMTTATARLNVAIPRVDR